MMKKVVFWLVVAFIVWMIVTAPSTAAHLVKDLWGAVTAAAHGFATFLKSL